MTSPWARRVGILITATVTVGVLAACTPAGTPVGAGPTGSSGSSAPTASPTPTAAASALDTTAPAPLLNLSCDDLASTTEIEKAYGTIHLAQTSELALGDLAQVGNALPVSDFIRQAGGVECLWDNGQDDNYRVTGAAKPSFEINVVFNAAGAWHRYQQIAFFTGNTMGACDVGICQEDDLVNGNTWLDILELEPKASQQSAVFAATIASAKQAILNAGTPATLPAPDPATLSLGTQCSDFVADSTVKSALGTSSSLLSSTPKAYLDDADFYSTWDGAQDALHDHPCVWKSAGKTVGALSWLPAGGWAWTEAQTHPLFDGPAKPLALTGLAAGDTASVRCSPSENTCIADLVIGGNWIEASLANTGSASKLPAITAIANGIVAKLG